MTSIEETHYLKDSTKQLYIKKISVLEKLLDEPILDIATKMFNKVMDVLHGLKLSKTTIIVYINSIIAYLIYSSNYKEKYYTAIQKWNEIKNELISETKERLLKNQPTEKQSKGFISYDRLCEISNKLPYGMLKLVFILYTQLPSLRGGDYTYLTTDDNDTDNYLDLENQKLVIREYKTSKKYGDIEIDINDDVIHDIEKCLNAMHHKHGYVFLGLDHKPYSSRQSFTSILNKRLKKLTNNPNFSMNIFRHAYLSRPEINTNNSLLERNKNAKAMGHSIMMSMLYKFNIDNHRESV